MVLDCHSTEVSEIHLEVFLVDHCRKHDSRDFQNLSCESAYPRPSMRAPYTVRTTLKVPPLHTVFLLLLSLANLDSYAMIRLFCSSSRLFVRCHHQFTPQASSSWHYNHLNLNKKTTTTGLIPNHHCHHRDGIATSSQYYSCSSVIASSLFKDSALLDINVPALLISLSYAYNCHFASKYFDEKQQIREQYEESLKTLDDARTLLKEIEEQDKIFIKLLVACRKQRMERQMRKWKRETTLPTIRHLKYNKDYRMNGTILLFKKSKNARM